MIEQKYNLRITYVEQEIQGALITGEAVSAFDETDGCAGLRISRSYFVGQQLVERTIGLYPASRFGYATTFNPTQRKV